MADMFNHGTETEVYTQFDAEGNCYAYASYDVPPGSPLRMSYGDATNPSKLLARYGFAEESSPATFCKIMIEEPSQPLLDLGYDHSRMLFYKDTGEVTPEVWDVLLYQLLESDPNSQQAFYQAHVSGDYDTKQAFHQQYAQNTNAALLNHIDSFLKDLEELETLAKSFPDPATHPRLPIIMRHNEFVKSAFLKVRSQLAQTAGVY